MKHYLFKLLFMICISLWANCSADCDCSKPLTFIDCPKTYVTPQQISFYKTGIFVAVGDFFIQTESLNADDQGIFFKNVRNEECGWMQWKCTKKIFDGVYCDTCNWIWYNNCVSCGKARGTD